MKRCVRAACAVVVVGLLLHTPVRGQTRDPSLSPEDIRNGVVTAQGGRSFKLGELSGKEREAFTLTRGDGPSPNCRILMPLIPHDPAARVDTTALREVIQSMPPKSYIVFTLIADTTGEPVIILDSKNISRTMSDEISARVRRSIVLGGTLRSSRFRLRLDADTTVGGGGIRMASPVVCAPYLLNRKDIERAIPSVRGRSGNAIIRGFVNVQGRVDSTKVQASSGDTQMDDDFAEIFRMKARWKPNMMDGVPQAVWVQVPFVKR